MFNVFATGSGYHRGNDLSLSLLPSLCTLLHSIIATTIIISHHQKRFSLSHIYTNMTFGLFTIITSTTLKNIFTNMSLHPVSTPHRACIIRHLPSLHLLVLAGYTYLLRFSPDLRHPVLVGPAPSGSCQVLLLRFSPVFTASFIRFTPGLPCRVRTSHPEGP